MAKRFGRNQRRKMREQIMEIQDKFESQVMKSVNLRREAGDLRRRLEKWARDIRDLVGDDSAFNETVRRIEVEHIKDFDGRLQLRPITHALSPGIASSNALVYGSVTSTIEALIYCANVSSEMRDMMERQVRIRLSSRNGDIGYAISEKRKNAWSTRDIDAMAEMIAHQMAAYQVKQRQAA